MSSRSATFGLALAGSTERQRGRTQSPQAMRENIPHLAMNSKPFREIRLRLIERERIGEFEIV